MTAPNGNNLRGLDRAVTQVIKYHFIIVFISIITAAEVHL